VDAPGVKSAKLHFQILWQKSEAPALNLQAKTTANDDWLTDFFWVSRVIYECGKNANHQAAVFPCPDETVAPDVII
jgi:hypothetical protein